MTLDTSPSTCPAHRCSVKTTEPLCRAHQHRVKTCLGELPKLYVQLSLSLAPGASVLDDARISGSRERPLGLSAHVRSLQEDMVRIVLDGETTYRHSQRWSATPCRGRESRRLQLGARYCVTHLDGIWQQSWSALFGVDVLGVVAQARATLGLDRKVHRLSRETGMPCPSCEMLALQRMSGDERVVCDFCGRAFGWDEYERLCLILASGHATAGAAS